MIKYDYKIERDEQDETRTYIPDLIPQELPDVVYIEGPNSAGKSTLLNLIALGFFGDHDDVKMNSTLKEKIRNLKSSDHQKVEFRIEIDNQELGKKLVAEKKDSEKDLIELVEVQNGKQKRIAPRAFFKDYKLIYDIPSNPLDRLRELLTEVQTAQKNIGDVLSRLRDFVRLAITEIQNGPNPDLISKKEKEIADLERFLKSLEQKIEKRKETLSKLQVFWAAKFYTANAKELDRVNGEMAALKKNLKSARQKETRKVNQASKLLREIEAIEANALEFFDEVNPILESLIRKKNDKHRLELWKTYIPRDDIRNPDDPQLRPDAKYFLRLVLEMAKTVAKGKKMKEAELVSELIRVVKQHGAIDMVIPGTGIRVKQFANALEEKLKEHQTDLIKKGNIAKASELLEALIAEIELGMEKFVEWRSKIEDKKQLALEIEETVDQKQERLAKKWEEYTAKVRFFLKEIHKVDIEKEDAVLRSEELASDPEVVVFDSYSDAQLRDELEDRKSEIEREEENYKQLNTRLSFISQELEEIRKKKPHKYSEHLEELNHWYEVIQELERKFAVKFSGHAKKLTAERVNKSKLSEEDLQYSKGIASFLGRKLETVPHVDRVHEIAEVDVVDKVIVTKSGKVIRFTDMGTGQGQGTYLKGLLSLSEDKKVIALFDEVAMMDKKTLKPIFERLKKLYEEKKLVLAIIVQKGEKVETKSII